MNNVPSIEREFSELDEIVLDYEKKLKKVERELKGAQTKVSNFKKSTKKETENFYRVLEELRGEKNLLFNKLASMVIQGCQSDYIEKDAKVLLRDYFMELTDVFGFPEMAPPLWFNCLVPEPASLESVDANNFKVEKEDDETDENFDDFEEPDFFGDGQAERDRKLWNEGLVVEKGNHSEDLKSVYYNLARRIHPDKVDKESKRELYTKLMVEVNRAYELGDAKKLFELEEQLDDFLLKEAIAEASPFNSSKLDFIDSIKRKVQLLSEQLESSRKELRLLKRSSLGKMGKELVLQKKRGVDLTKDYKKDLDDEERTMKEIVQLIENELRNRRRTSRFQRKLSNLVASSMFGSAAIYKDDFMQFCHEMISELVGGSKSGHREKR